LQVFHPLVVVPLRRRDRRLPEKICEYKGRLRDRCELAWWGSFRGIRVSLARWANREIHSKAEAQAVLDEMRTAIRSGAFDPRRRTSREVTPMTFCELSEIL